MEKYELLFILPAKYTEAELVGMTDKIKGIATGLGAKVTESHQLGRRRLAYPIKNARNGNYVLVYLEAEPAVMPKLNESLRLSTDLLRHLIVDRNPHITKIPSLIEEERRTGRDGEHEVEERPRYRRPAPVQQRPIVREEVDVAALDKKLDEMLTEEIK